MKFYQIGKRNVLKKFTYIFLNIRNKTKNINILNFHKILYINKKIYKYLILSLQKIL